MRVIDVSLLWPGDKCDFANATAPLYPATAINLELDGLYRSMSQNENEFRTIKDILSELCRDEEVIRYRQDIFDDFIASEQIVTAFEEILRQLGQVESTTIRAETQEESRLWQLFSRFKELEGYVDCVLSISNAIRDIPLKSKGLQAFREKAGLLSQDAEFLALTGVVKSLNLELNEIQSITLGINLDSMLNPQEATLVSVNKTRFTDQNFLREMISLFSKGAASQEDLGGVSKLHRASADKRDHIMNLLYRELEKYLRPVVKDLSAALNRYAHVYTGYMTNIMPEIVFYLGFTRLYKKLMKNKMPCCRPTIAKSGDRLCDITDAYNINLALHMIHTGYDPSIEIVKNHMSFGDGGRVLIITGPNRGGKTVYTQAVGLAQVLFQAGVFVPGTSAVISPADNIFSHFPVDESQTVELGRLGEETKRLGEIFHDSTRLSLVLLNESLTSTSYTEGLYLAQEVVRAIRYLGARAIFNTHMHELAESVGMLNNKTTGDSVILSMITGIIEGKRSYIVEPGAPLGKSYAMDIAARFGVSFEQIAGVIDKKNL
jgi:DNA mismatch repair protein MutS